MRVNKYRDQRKGLLYKGMALKTVVSALDSVPEAIRDQYIKTADGNYTLQIEGTPPGFVTVDAHNTEAARVTEFRDKNTALLKEAATMMGLDKVDGLTEVKARLAQLSAVDPAEFERLKKAAEDLKERGIGKPGDVQVQIAAEIEKLRTDEIAPLQTQLQGVKGELKEANDGRAAAEADVLRGVSRTALSEKFIAIGGIPTAVEYIFGEYEKDFHTVDGVTRARPGKLSKVNAGQAIDVDEWLSDQTKTHGFAFGPSEGGGADGRPSPREPNTGPIRTRDGTELSTDGISVLS